MDLSFLLNLVPSLLSDFRGETSAPYLKEQKNLANQQAAYAQALANPASSTYQSLYQNYRNQGAGDMADAIREAQGQNRMYSSMGRTPLFSQERGGEVLFRNLMKGYEDVGAQADTQTKDSLSKAIYGTNTAGQSLNTVSKFAQNKNAQKLQGFKNLASLLQYNQTPQSTTDYDNTDDYFLRGFRG